MTVLERAWLMVSVCCLGGFEVSSAARKVVVRESIGARLFATLLVRANDVVPANRLAAEIWIDVPPHNEAKALQVQIFRLRSRLRKWRLPASVVSRRPGFSLQIDLLLVDIHLFESLLRRARSAGSYSLAEESLALWRGDPFEGMRMGPLVSSAALRLQEERLEALELLLELRLAVDRAPAPAQLLELASLHPHREYLAELVMVGLYRAGYTTEAIKTFHLVKRALADDLGVNPSPRLAGCLAQILRHDPDLRL